MPEPSEPYRLRPATDADRTWIDSVRRSNYMMNAPIMRIAGYSRDEIVEAMNDWTKRSLGEMEKYDSLHVTIAETTQGIAVAYIMVLWPAQDDFAQLPQGYIQDLGVVRAHWGTGVAALLMEHAERFIREQGGLFVALNVNAQNGRAVAFYKKNGYMEEWKTMGKCLVTQEEIEAAQNESGEGVTGE